MLRRASLLVASLVLAACSDATTPFHPEPAEVPLTAISCQAAVGKLEVSCGAPIGPSANLVVGGQGQYVMLRNADANYQADSALFTFSVTVQNLIWQPLATTNGTTPSADGVRIFFQNPPTATSLSDPSGVSGIEVLGDGTGLFTASNQDYYQYAGAELGDDGILGQNETSSPRTWRLRVPPNVQTFVFTVFVAAHVPFPQGHLEVQPGGFALEVGDSVTLRAVRRNAVGNALAPPQVTWSSLNPGIASVDEDGHVTAHSSGYAVIRARTEGREPIDTDIMVASRSGQRYRAVSTGGFHGCLMTEARSAFCFGEGMFGQLGHGAYEDEPQIRPVRVADEPWDTVTVGHHTTCGLKSGQAFCWGLDVFGGLGTGELLDPCRDPPYGASSYGCSNRPLPVAGDLRFTRLTTGGNHFIKVVPYSTFSCGLTFAGARHCWGSDGHGELGDGTEGPLDNPAPVAANDGINFRLVVSGFDHACGIDLADAAWCWGDELRGELGDDAQLDDEEVAPRRVQGGLRFAQIDAARDHSCGVTVDGVVFCWGSNTSGQLGTAAVLPDCGTDRLIFEPCSPVPLPIASTLRFQRVAVGRHHTCAITTDGEAWCWGQAEALGAGDLDRIPGVERCPTGNSKLCVRRPTRVHTRMRFRDLDGSHRATCALSTAGHAYCWPLWGVAPGGVTTHVPTRIPEPV